MKSDNLSTLAYELQSASSLETAARLAGSALYRVMQQDFAEDRALLRLIVHIRDKNTYTNLHCESWTEEDPLAVDLASSASLWEKLSETKVPTILDISIGEIAQLTDHGYLTSEVPGQPVSAATTERYRARAASHVVAWPLIHHSGELKGMMCLELNSPTHIGLSDQWQASVEEANQIVKIAQLTLLALSTPAKNVEESESNPIYEIPYLTTFAKQPETILITGKTGTGKSHLAKEIHSISKYRRGPLVTYSVIGLSTEMQLAHLFGWKKGAFTGATDNNPGLIETAANGTLFIDEVDKLGRDAQAGLLEVLQDRSYLRLGDNTRREATNVRFVAASNANLASLIEDGKFREDLFFRLNVLPISLPNLDPMSPIFGNAARRLLSTMSTESNPKEPLSLSPEAMRSLRCVQWPGNLRQLDNVLKRAAIFCGSRNSETIDREDVEQALGLESQDKSPNPLESLIRWSEELIRSGQDTKTNFSPILESIKSNLGFACLWYSALVLHDYDHKNVAALIGKEASFNSRNYQKELKREMAKLLSAYRAFNLEPPSSLTQFDS